MKPVFNRFDKTSNWVSGYVIDDNSVRFDFEAKLFDIPSIFGIDDGRVSKLWIESSGKTVTNYDRGWDVEPAIEVLSVYKSILEFLENSPKRFEV